MRQQKLKKYIFKKWSTERDRDRDRKRQRDRET